MTLLHSIKGEALISIPEKYIPELNYAYYSLYYYDLTLLKQNLAEWLKTGFPRFDMMGKYFFPTNGSRILKRWEDWDTDGVNLLLEALDWIDNNPDADLSEYKHKKQKFEDILVFNKILRAELMILLELRKDQNKTE